MRYVLKVDLVCISDNLHKPTGLQIEHFFGSVQIADDIQQHIEMAGRAAAVQAYFEMLWGLTAKARANCGTK